MTWTLTPHGSWADAVTDSPATELAAVLALPQSYPWYPYSHTVLVRNDQWVNVNLLTAAQSDFEDGSTGGVIPGNCTVANSTAQAHTGTHCLAATIAASSDATVTYPPLPVSAKATYRVSGWLRSAATPRSISVGAWWYDAGDAFLGAANTNVTTTTTSWTQSSTTGQAPAAATHVRVLVYLNGPAAGEVHYVDTVSLGLVAT
jgi:hypothetical protein